MVTGGELCQMAIQSDWGSLRLTNCYTQYLFHATKDQDKGGRKENKLYSERTLALIWYLLELQIMYCGQFISMVLRSRVIVLTRPGGMNMWCINTRYLIKFELWSIKNRSFKPIICTSLITYFPPSNPLSLFQPLKFTCLLNLYIMAFTTHGWYVYLPCHFPCVCQIYIYVYVYVKLHNCLLS